MKSRVGGLIFLAVASLLVLGVTACDDDDDDGDDGGNGDATATAGTNGGGADEELTLYFQDLAAIQEELNTGIETVDDQSQAGGDPASTRQSLNAVSTAGQAALSDLNELEVPADAADAHNALEDAGEAYLAAVDSLADELQNISAGEEFDTWVAEVNDPDSEYSMAKADLQEGCADMQTLADDNNVDVALECPV